jgi:CRISPR/Cas system-associated protein Csm6
MGTMIIITTVGTSLFTNFRNPEFVQDHYKQRLNEDDINEILVDLDAEKQISDVDKTKINSALDKLIFGVERINANNGYTYKKLESDALNINASAEIKSICKIADGKSATVYLLATDTDMSEFAAEKIKDTLNKSSLNIDVVFDSNKKEMLNKNFELITNNFKEEFSIDNSISETKNFEVLIKQSQLSKKKREKALKDIKTLKAIEIAQDALLNNKFRIPDLKIDKPSLFNKSGFNNLLYTVDYIVKINPNQEVILNISGGYKALIPFLTIYAQLQGIKINYIYEDSLDLIELDSSFLGFNESEVEVIEPFLNSQFLNKDKHTEDEINILKNLTQRHYISENKDILALGHLVKNFASKHIVLTKGALGDIVEIKLWEYFMHNNCINNLKYKVEHGIKIKSQNEQPADIDLFFTEFDTEANKIFCEIKSFSRCFHEIQDIKKDYEKRQRIAEANAWNLKEYWLLIYKAHFHDKTQLDFSVFNGIDNFKVRYIDIDVFDEIKVGFNSHSFLHKPLEQIKIY